MQIKTKMSVLYGCITVLLFTACSKKNDFPLNPAETAQTGSKLPTASTTSRPPVLTVDFKADIEGNQVRFQPIVSDPAFYGGYSWRFGDGSPLDFTKNPSHTYSVGSSPYEKECEIVLTIMDYNTRETANIFKKIRVFYPLSFTDDTYEYLGEDGLVRYEVTVTNTTPDGIYSDYEWHSGNGETFHTKSPVFHYFRSEDGFPYDYFPYVIMTNAVTGRKYYKYLHYRF